MTCALLKGGSRASGESLCADLGKWYAAMTNSAPIITSNGGGTSAAINVAENGTAVTTVTATDVDGQTLTYSISGTDASKFSINSSTGVLTFISAPNYKSPTDSGGNNVYDLVVTVSDGSLTDTQAVAVTVTNVNEAPTITSAATASVAENATTVMTVTSTDPDAGATKTYSINGGADASLFTINSSTGALDLHLGSQLRSRQPTTAPTTFMT